MAGERGSGFWVAAVVEQRGTVPLFEDPRALADAERERYDAVLLVPRDPREGPWEASVAVKLGRRVARSNDPGSGKCVEPPGEAPALPEWSLFSLPAHCGDGVRQDDEDCDDGNRAGGDGCSPWCFKEE